MNKVFRFDILTIVNQRSGMMIYQVITKFPTEESIDSETLKYVTNSKKEQTPELEIEDVVAAYNDYQRAGYNVTPTFKVPMAGETDEDISPFDVAEQLTTAGIDYMATLKLKYSGDYEGMLELSHLIEAHGFDLVVDIKLKVNEDSVVNLDNEGSWMGDDAVYKVTPKAKNEDINELKGIYDTLSDAGYDVSIDIKPKAQKEDDDDNFFAQVSAYPSGTQITLTLKDSTY